MSIFTTKQQYTSHFHNKTTTIQYSTMEQEIIMALLRCIEKYPEGETNKIWFIKLFQNSLHNQQDPDLDMDLIYNATKLENLLARILATDIKTIVKVRMVQKVILTLWEENQWDLDNLNSYALESKPNIEMEKQLEQEINSTNKQTNVDPLTIHGAPIMQHNY